MDSPGNADGWGGMELAVLIRPAGVARRWWQETREREKVLFFYFYGQSISIWVADAMDHSIGYS